MAGALPWTQCIPARIPPRNEPQFLSQVGSLGWGLYECRSSSELVERHYFRERFALHWTEVVYGISDRQHCEGSICGRQLKRLFDFVFEEQVVGRQACPKPDRHARIRF